MRKKIVVVGDGGCGKTCLLISFTKNEFPEVHIPTVFDTHVKTIQVEDKDIELSLFDTAGEEDFDRLRPLAYPSTDLMIICYSINFPDSLYNVKEKWAKEVKYFCKNVPIILVGNKLDLRTPISEASTCVTYKEGLAMAKKIKAVAFFECSSKIMFHVRDIFTKAAYILSEEKKKSCCFRNKVLSYYTCSFIVVDLLVMCIKLDIISL